MSGESKGDNISPKQNKNLSVKTKHNSLAALRYWKNKKKVIPTSAMRINAYAIPLRERIVIISNRGHYFQKYAYKALHVSENDCNFDKSGKEDERLRREEEEHGSIKLNKKKYA